MGGSAQRTALLKPEAGKAEEGLLSGRGWVPAYGGSKNEKV